MAAIAPAATMPPPAAPSTSDIAAGGPARRRPVSRAEKFLVAVTGLNLVLVGWAFGGVDLVTQRASALLGAVGLLAALRVRRDRAGTDEAAAGATAALRRFPVFWAGLALFAYVIVQAVNPAWLYQETGRGWWLEAAPHVAWLPAGMGVPFADAGPLRSLLTWFTPWATVCALWIGLTQRVTIVALLNVIAANGFLLGSFGLVQLASGMTGVYGFRATQSTQVFASFIYRNHAAAYFILMAATAVAVALDSLRRRRRSERSPHGPAILYFLFAFTSLTAVVLTFSLGGLVLLAASWGLLAVATAGRFAGTLAGGRVRWPGVVMVLAIVALVGGIAAISGSAPLRAHLRHKLEGGGAQQSLHSRWLAARQGAAMFMDRPAYGWGAGCFRYGFTKYQRREIELAGTGLQRLFWEHAHNDWLEWLIELGIVGVAPILFIAGCWARLLFKSRFWRTPALVWCAGGTATVAGYAFFDFPFQNPAVLSTAAGLFCLAARWSELAAGESTAGGAPRPPPPRTA